MSLTSLEYKAISKYSQQHDVVPQLSLYPMVTFKAKDGEITERHILTLMSQYEEAKKEETKQRALERKEAKALEEKQRKFI